MSIATDDGRESRRSNKVEGEEEEKQCWPRVSSLLNPWYICIMMFGSYVIMLMLSIYYIKKVVTTGKLLLQWIGRVSIIYICIYMYIYAILFFTCAINCASSISVSRSLFI